LNYHPTATAATSVS